MNFDYTDVNGIKRALIRVEARYGMKTGQFQATLDTGADCCVIPMHVLKAIKAKPINTTEISDFMGNKHQKQIWQIKLIFGEDVYLVECIDTEGKYGYLGLDFLKCYVWTFYPDRFEVQAFETKQLEVK